MEKNQKRATYIILNSNVLFSSLIKEEGFTRAVLLLLMRSEEFKFVIPKTVVNEFKLHAGEIARKARLPIAYIK
jgi:predicted nucleic acid-binding protein